VKIAATTKQKGRTMKTTRRSFVGGAAALALTSAAKAQSTPLAITIGMPNPTVQALGAYYSSVPATLYWKDAGLAVKLVNLNGINAAAEALNAGLIDVTLGASEGLYGVVQANPNSVVGIYALINRFQTVLATLKDGPIQTVLDLQGKIVGVQSLANSQLPITKALVKQAGGDPATVKFLPVGDIAEAALAISRKQVDAIVMADGQIAQINEQGVALSHIVSPSLDFTKIGFAGAVFTRRDYLSKSRETLVRMLRGIAKATIFAKENPEAAIRLHWQFYPATKPRGAASDADAMRQSLVTLKARLENVEPSEGLYGYATKEQIESFTNLLVIGGLLKRQMSDEEFWTADLIKDVNAFDREAILQQAKNWKA
jgi:NitT/TauT family transport system substrate-binding protein